MELLLSLTTFLSTVALFRIYYKLSEMHKDSNEWMVELHKSIETTNVSLCDLSSQIADEAKKIKGD